MDILRKQKTAKEKINKLEEFSEENIQRDKLKNQENMSRQQWYSEKSNICNWNIKSKGEKD